MKRTILAAALAAAALLTTVSPAHADTYPSGQIAFSQNFYIAGGAVNCVHNTGSSYGTRPSDGALWVKSQYTALSGPVGGCIRQSDGVDITGTGAGQYYGLFAFQLLDGATVVFTSLPVVLPHTSGGWSYDIGSSSYLGKTIRTLYAVCAGNNGGCTYPAVITTLSPS